MRRRIAATAAAVLALVALTAGGAWAGNERTAITDDCVHVAERPTSIVFACADGGFLVRHLDWSSWRRNHASARGVFRENDCDPSCAEGHVHTRPGLLRVHGRRWCPDIERYVFRRAVIRFDAPLLGRDEMRFGLSCPL
jgi:hypothetical protein